MIVKNAALMQHVKFVLINSTSLKINVYKTQTKSTGTLTSQISNWPKHQLNNSISSSKTSIFNRRISWLYANQYHTNLTWLAFLISKPESPLIWILKRLSLKSLLNSTFSRFAKTLSSNWSWTEIKYTRTTTRDRISTTHMSPSMIHRPIATYKYHRWLKAPHQCSSRK